MAAIVVDSDARGKFFHAFALFPEGIEEVQGFRDRFKETEGFRFEPKMQVEAFRPCDFFHPRGAGNEILKKNLGGGLIRNEFLEGSGQGADAPFGSPGKEFLEQVEKQQGVVQTFRRGPVGSVHLLFHPGTMEASVGKTIDRKNVTIHPLQPTLEGKQFLGVGEFPRGFRSQSQTDGKGIIRAYLLPDLQNVALEGVKGFGPIVSPMHVRAVRQVRSAG